MCLTLERDTYRHINKLRVNRLRSIPSSSLFFQMKENEENILLLCNFEKSFAFALFKEAVVRMCSVKRVF